MLPFGVGNFYETFGQDAVIAPKELGITFTKRSNALASETAFGGFPYHALDAYLRKLVKGRYRVAICGQIERSKMVKGIVNRGVIE